MRLMESRCKASMAGAASAEALACSRASLLWGCNLPMLAQSMAMCMEHLCVQGFAKAGALPISKFAWVKHLVNWKPVGGRCSLNGHKDPIQIGAKTNAKAMLRWPRLFGPTCAPGRGNKFFWLWDGFGIHPSASASCTNVRHIFSLKRKKTQHAQCCAKGTYQGGLAYDMPEILQVRNGSDAAGCSKAQRALTD